MLPILMGEWPVLRQTFLLGTQEGQKYFLNSPYFMGYYFFVEFFTVFLEPFSKI
jgi:hypothetical protein